MKFLPFSQTKLGSSLLLRANGSGLSSASISVQRISQRKFSLIFNESNYIEPKKMEVLEGENLITQKEIDFFTETPIIIIKD